MKFESGFLACLADGGRCIRRTNHEAGGNVGHDGLLVEKTYPARQLHVQCALPEWEMGSTKWYQRYIDQEDDYLWPEFPILFKEC